MPVDSRLLSRFSFIHERNAVRTCFQVFVTLCCVLVSLHRVYAQEPQQIVEVFPGSKIFPRFTADGLSHGLSISRITENREWIGAIGGSVPLVQLNLEKAKLQASVAVTVFNRLIKTPGHITVYTMDYKVDIPIDIRFSELSLRTALGHISCHFADDAIELLGRRSIQHVNDYATLAAAYDVEAIQGHVYAGCNYSYGTNPVPNVPWLFQVGTEFAIVALNEYVSVYGAIDIKVREEVGWGSTRSFQVGCKLLPRLNYGLRLAYTLRMGYEDRGQFYLNRETLNLLSAFIDL